MWKVCLYNHEIGATKEYSKLSELRAEDSKKGENLAVKPIYHATAENQCLLQSASGRKHTMRVPELQQPSVCSWHKKKLFKTTNQGLSVFRQSAKSTSSLSLYNFLQHLLNYLGTIFWNSRNNITTLTYYCSYIYRYSAHFPGSCSHMVLQASGENVRNAAQQTSNALIFYCALNSS